MHYVSFNNTYRRQKCQPTIAAHNYDALAQMVDVGARRWEHLYAKEKTLIKAYDLESLGTLQLVATLREEDFLTHSYSSQCAQGIYAAVDGRGNTLRELGHPDVYLGCNRRTSLWVG